MKKIIPSKITVIGNVAEVELTRGFKALVDVEDIPKVSLYKWRIIKGTSGIYYAVTALKRIGTKRPSLYMHRVILNTSTGLKTDHVNRNGLDNRRNNLREANTSQNAINRVGNKNRKYGAKFKGVSFDGSQTKRWIACIEVNGVHKTIGRFDSQEEALEARIAASQKYFGEFSREASLAKP